MTEIIFDVIESNEGGYEARTRARYLHAGRGLERAKGDGERGRAVPFDAAETPRVIRLRQVRDEVIAV